MLSLLVCKRYIRGARRGLLEKEKLLATEILLSAYIKYLPGSHKLQPSLKYDLAKSWDEIVDSVLGLTSAGNAELECCGRCCLQIPDQYIYKIDDHNTWVNRVKSIKKYRNILRKQYKVQQSAKQLYHLIQLVSGYHA